MILRKSAVLRQTFCFLAVLLFVCCSYIKYENRGFGGAKMESGKRLLWIVRAVLCVTVLAAGMVLHWGIGGQAYAAVRTWYVQQEQCTAMPDFSANGLKQQFQDILASCSSITMPQPDASQNPTSSVPTKPAASAKS